jgi:hypothetical protein
MHAMARIPSPLVLAAALLVAASALAGCGGDDEEDWRSDANQVFDRAMRAVHDGDWKSLRGLLTYNARLQLERDLRRLQRRLAHPTDGKREREIAAARLGDRYDAEVERAVGGTLSDMLRFFVLISPREAKPPTGMRKFTRFETEILYGDGAGNERRVRLLRRPDGWYVDDLQL